MVGGNGLNTQNQANATNRGVAPQRADEPVRVPTVKEYMLRLFGFKRNQSLFGVEGDKIASAYPRKRWDWAIGSDEPIPVFLEQSRQNQTKAYVSLIALAIFGFFIVTSILTPHPRMVKSLPPEELSPAEKLLMSTVQGELGVSDKAMNDFYNPPALPPEPAAQTEASQQSAAPPPQQRPPSMRTFGLRAQQQQAQMQQPQQQFGAPVQQQQQQFGDPSMQAGQPHRMQVFVER